MIGLVGCGTRFEHPDQYQVISDRLYDAMQSNMVKSGVRIVLVSDTETLSKKDMSYYKEIGFADLQESTLGDFNAKNEQSIRLVREKFAKDLEFDLISKEELDAMFSAGEEEGWSRLRERFSKLSMVLRHSAVAFSDDGTQAFFSGASSNGGTGGGRFYTLLVWTGDRWEMDKHVLVSNN